MKQIVNLRINGAEHETAVHTHHTLLEVLRAEFKLFGAREGCGSGMSGPCPVLLDGRPVSSCLTLAALAEGHDIVTVEGLGAPGPLDLVQQAFVDRTGFQCSYCTPGILLTTRALLDENPDASDEEIRDYLAGNLCRCGSYVKIMDSIREAIARLHAGGGA